MNKIDEMDRNIQLYSIERGYKVVMISLSIWTLFNCYQTLIHGAKFHILPSVILTLAVCVQSFSQMAMKQKMIEGDEEYKEPNRVLQSILAIIIIVAVTLSIGSYVLLKNAI